MRKKSILMISDFVRVVIGEKAGGSMPGKAAFRQYIAAKATEPLSSEWGQQIWKIFWTNLDQVTMFRQEETAIGNTSERYAHQRKVS